MRRLKETNRLVEEENETTKMKMMRRMTTMVVLPIEIGNQLTEMFLRNVVRYRIW